QRHGQTAGLAQPQRRAGSGAAGNMGQQAVPLPGGGAAGPPPPPPPGPPPPPAGGGLASRPFGTGLTAAGSRIARNANMPEIAASRWFTVVAAYSSIRRPPRVITFGPGR